MTTFYMYPVTTPNRIPRFEDFHPSIAIPLHYLIYAQPEHPVMKSLRQFSDAFIPTLSVYSENDVFENEYWLDKTPPPPSIGNLPFQNSFYEDNKERINFGFKPKYRIVIKREQQSKTRIFEVG
ncbi:MAG: hypothetical protein AB8G22_09505 [Saprospiraceae bacterium]